MSLLKLIHRGRHQHIDHSRSRWPPVGWLILSTVHTSPTLSLHIPAAGTQPVTQKKRHSEYSYGCRACAPKQCSLSFPSLRTLFILVLFYTMGPDWAREGKHLPDFQFNDTTAGSCFLRFARARQKTKRLKGPYSKGAWRSLMCILFNGRSNATTETASTRLEQSDCF